MKVKKEETLKYKLMKRIEGFSKPVFLRRDVLDLGGRQQINRALKELMDENRIGRIGYGMYTRLVHSEYLDFFMPEEDLGQMAREVFNRLNVQWDFTEAQKEYNEGKSTQVPARVAFRLKSRFRRKIDYNGWQVRYEGGINAR